MNVTPRIESCVLLAMLLAAPAGAQQVGEVVAHDRIATLQPATAPAPRSCPPDPTTSGDKDSTCPLRLQASPVGIGDEMKTEGGGRARVFLYDERFPTRKRQFEILNQTTVRILENGLSISPLGSVRWMGSGSVELPDGRSVNATKTEFIVHHTAEGVTKVIAVSDGVEVRDREQGVEETLRAGDRVLMEPGAPPKFLERLVGEDLDRQKEPFLFIGGGRAESQTVRNALLAGDEVPLPDRAPLPAPQWKDDDRLWPEQPVLVDLFVRF